MEYLIGFLLSLFVFVGSAWALIYNKIIIIKMAKTGVGVLTSQSRNLDLVSDILKSRYGSYDEISRETQSINHIKSLQEEIRVVFEGEDAYWIDQGKFVKASVINGHIDIETKRIVDTISVNKVELEKLSIIVDKLTEGASSDNRNSRDS